MQLFSNKDWGGNTHCEVQPGRAGHSAFITESWALTAWERGRTWMTVCWSSRSFANTPLFYNKSNQVCVQTVQGTATDPAGYYTVLVITAVLLWIENTSEKLRCLFCVGHLRIYWLNFYIHLCLCAYFSSFSLISFLSVRRSPLSETKGEGEQWRVNLDKSFIKKHTKGHNVANSANKLTEADIQDLVRPWEWLVRRIFHITQHRRNST